MVITRKYIVLLACVAVLALVALPAGAAEKSIKVGVYGGYFKDSFDKHIFPDFTKETGIKVESVAEPTGEAWLVQLEQAAKAGVAPADVNMIAQVPMLRGQKTQLWKPLDLNKIPNSKNLNCRSSSTSTRTGRWTASGRCPGTSPWSRTPRSSPKPRTPGATCGPPDKKDKLGLLALVSNSFLLEVTATTFFGGTKILDTQDGIQKVLDKLAAIKPNVKLWYRDEAQFEQALKSGEIPMGQYYHDVASLAAKDHPVRSTFPKEGGILDSGTWAVTKACKKVEEAHIFINYMCRPDIQKKLSVKVGTSPTVKKELVGLSPEEFAAVSSDIKPIIPRYDIYTGKMSDWINQKWTDMITK